MLKRTHRYGPLCLLVASVLILAGSRARADVVTTEDVRRFLDPTLMISRLEYQFQANYLPGDLELYTHKVRPWYAVNASNAVWVRLPFLRYSLPNGGSESGIGDISLGWGFVVHENLKRRFTTLAAGFDIILPTGDPAKATGFDSYVLRTGVGVVTNPTDMFPVFLIGKYHQSIHTLEGGLDISTLELTLQTFHILPKGFYLALLPSFFFDFENDFDVFSLGVGGGRALTKQFSIQGTYVQHATGRKTFNRGFAMGLHYLWGVNKGK